MKIVKEIYERLKQSGKLDVLIKHLQLPVEIKQRLDQLMTITQKPPTISPEPGPREFPFIFSQLPTVSSPPLEFSYIAMTPQELESQYRTIYQVRHLEQLPQPPPPIAAPSVVPVAPAAPQLEVATSQAAQEKLAETIAQTVQEMPPNIPLETKQEIITQNIQEEQQKLVSEGNLSALKPDVVKEAAADAAVVTGKPETISKATEEVTGLPKEEVKQTAEEKKEVLESITNVPLAPSLEQESLRSAEQETKPLVQEPEESKKRGRTGVSGERIEKEKESLRSAEQEEIEKYPLSKFLVEKREKIMQGTITKKTLTKLEHLLSPNNKEKVEVEESLNKLSEAGAKEVEEILNIKPTIKYPDKVGIYKFRTRSAYKICRILLSEDLILPDFIFNRIVDNIHSFNVNKIHHTKKFGKEEYTEEEYIEVLENLIERTRTGIDSILKTNEIRVNAAELIVPLLYYVKEPEFEPKKIKVEIKNKIYEIFVTK